MLQAVSDDLCKICHIIIIFTLNLSIEQSICSAVDFAEKNSLGLPKWIPSIINTIPEYQNIGEVVINLFSIGSSNNDLKKCYIIELQKST